MVELLKKGIEMVVCGWSGVHSWHSSPSPCSSPQRRGDVGLSIFVSLVSFRSSGKLSLSHGERRATAGEGVSCLLGGNHG